MIRWLLATVLLATTAGAQDRIAQIKDAQFDDPTDRYAHGILGDAIEYGSLVLTVAQCPGCTNEMIVEITLKLPENRVFEDLSPRVADLDYDGFPEVIVVETDLALGAQLAVYGVNGKLAETPFLGRPHRWLAPIGVADFNGDGLIDIAYIEKPHLTKLLKIWSFENGDLRQIAEASGLTNHRIGEDYITGGVRVCDEGPEMITVDADWRYIVASRLVGRDLEFETLGAFLGQNSIADAMACR